jgi:hypothetical protein
MFYRVGIRAVGVDEIVRQAGAPNPALPQLFSTRAGGILSAIRAGILGAFRPVGLAIRKSQAQIVNFLPASANAPSSRTIAAAA